MVDHHHMVPHGGFLDVFPTDMTGIPQSPMGLNIVTGELVQSFKSNITQLTSDLCILCLLPLTLLFCPVCLLDVSGQLFAGLKYLLAVLTLVVRRAVETDVLEEGLFVDVGCLTEFTGVDSLSFSLL